MKTYRLPLSCLIAGLLAGAGCSKTEDTTDTTSAPANDGAPKAAAKPAKPKEKFTFKVTWPVGKQYQFQSESDQETTINISNAQGPRSLSTTFKQAATMAVAKERENGGREMIFEITSQTMQVKSGENAIIDFDSSRPAKDDRNYPMSKDLRKAIGPPLTYHVDARGNVQDLPDYKTFIGRVTRTISPQAKAMMQSTYSETNLKQIGFFPVSVPEGPVAEGDTWKDSIELNLGPQGSGQLELNFTFAGWDERDGVKLARMEGEGILMKPASATATPAPGGNPGAASGPAEMGTPEGEGAPEALPGAEEEAGMAEPGGGPAGEPAAPPVDPNELGRLNIKFWLDPEKEQMVEQATVLNLRLEIPGPQQTVSTKSKTTTSTKITGIQDYQPKP